MMVDDNGIKRDYGDERLFDSKPCPFCGGDDLAFHLHNTFGEYIIIRTDCMVVCTDCGARGPLTMDGEEAARALWNERGE